MILTFELVREFSPVYVTTKQKADICSSFQNNMWTGMVWYSWV